MSWCNPCPPAPCQPAQYQPLPISTGNVGIDRCGNIEVYAAPTVVRNTVSWGCWPIQFQGWWLYQGPFGPWGSGPGAGGAWGGLSQLMTQGGAAAANWMIASRGAAR